MRCPAILALAFLALTSCSAPRLSTQSGGYVQVQGKGFITPDGKPLVLKGTNLGNWLLPEGYMFHFGPAAAPWQIDQVIRELVGPAEAQAFWRAWRDNYVTHDDIRYIKSLGMNHVRVPFNYKLFTPEDYPGVMMGPGFEMLDRVIRWSKTEGLYVILDMHGAPCGQTGENIDDGIGYPWLFESEECQQRTISLWREIAKRYAKETMVIGYDLLNEPIPHFEGYSDLNPRLEPLYKRITAAIREVDPHHVVFLGGAQWDSNFKVFGPPFDKQAAYTFHKYWTAPTPDVIQEYVAFRDKYDVPIWMGESGENTDAWIDSFRVTLDNENISWSFWPYKRMDASRCVVTFDRPVYWDEIVAYQKLFGAGFEDKRKGRPSREHARAALADLIEKIKPANRKPNSGYIRALGFKPI